MMDLTLLPGASINLRKYFILISEGFAVIMPFPHRLLIDIKFKPETAFLRKFVTV